jgi:choline monooxygenase
MDEQDQTTNAAASYLEAADLNASRAELEHARHLPAHFYTSPEIFELEKEKLIFRDWLAVAREDEIPNPGDYKTFEIAGEPIVISRAKDSTLHAFANSCRHRGTRIVDGTGNARDFTCPYHGWCYDLTGKLIAPLRPTQMGKFDIASCRMPAVQIDAYGGFIFINFDTSADSLGAFLDVEDFRNETSFLRCEDLMTVDTYAFDIDANWKVVMETLADVYHVEVVHRETFGKRGTGYKPQTTADLKLTKYGSRKFYSVGTFAPDGQALFGPMPWLKDHPNGTNLGFSFYLRPNLAFFGRSDMIQPCVALPLSIDRTHIIVWTCMPAEFQSLPAYDEKIQIIKDFCRKVNAEDIDLILALQRGLSSRFYPQGPMHELEKLVHHRTQGYLDALAGDGDFR